MLLIIRGNVYKKVYNGAVMNNLMNKMLAVNLFAGFYVVATDKHLQPLSRQYHMESAPEPPSMDLHTHT